MSESLFELTTRAVEAVTKRAMEDIKKLVLEEAKLVEFPLMIFAIKKDEGVWASQASPQKMPGVVLVLPISQVLHSEDRVVLTPEGIFEHHWTPCKIEPTEKNRFHGRDETELRLALRPRSESPQLYIRYAEKALEEIAKLPRKNAVISQTV